MAFNVRKPNSAGFPRFIQSSRSAPNVSYSLAEGTDTYLRGKRVQPRRKAKSNTNKSTRSKRSTSGSSKRKTRSGSKKKSKTKKKAAKNKESVLRFTKAHLTVLFPNSKKKNKTFKYISIVKKLDKSFLKKLLNVQNG